jgi:hypothetical protein
MATTKTVSTKTNVIKGAGTLVTHSAVTKPSLGGSYSLHDCAEPWQASVMNCIWPIAMSGNGVTFMKGLTVHHRNPTDAGTVSVTTA